MSKKVEIYSKSNCSYCVMAMNFFDSKNMQYEVYSADDPKIFSEMMERNPQARTVPQIFIDDQLIGGYTDLIEKYSD
jgi:thioredoxin reductase (NADPH)|tara:strand:- start:873 stop:1103 length:231 start_codon:yes stop_codon:yes gene_type:complete